MSEREPGFWGKVRGHWRAIRALNVGNLGWRPWNTVRGADKLLVPAPWILNEFPEFARHVLPEPIETLRVRIQFRKGSFRAALAKPGARILLAFFLLWIFGLIAPLFSKILPPSVVAIPSSCMLYLFYLLFFAGLAFYMRLRVKTVFPRNARAILVTENPSALEEIMTTRIRARDIFLAGWAGSLSRWQIDGKLSYFMGLLAVALTPLASRRVPPALYASVLCMILLIGTFSTMLAGATIATVFRYQVVAMEVVRNRARGFFGRLKAAWRRFVDALPFEVLVAMHASLISLLIIAEVAGVVAILVQGVGSYRSGLMAVGLTASLRVLLPLLLRRHFHRYVRYAVQRHLARFESDYSGLRDMQRDAMDEGRPLPRVGPATR